MPSFFQEVLARCFEQELEIFDQPECYFNSISSELKEKREHVLSFLKDIGFKPVIPEGGFFMIADISDLVKNDFQTDEIEHQDKKFCKYLIKNIV